MILAKYKPYLEQYDDSTLKSNFLELQSMVCNYIYIFTNCEALTDVSIDSGGDLISFYTDDNLSSPKVTIFINDANKDLIEVLGDRTHEYNLDAYMLSPKKYLELSHHIESLYTNIQEFCTNVIDVTINKLNNKISYSDNTLKYYFNGLGTFVDLTKVSMIYPNNMNGKKIRDYNLVFDGGTQVTISYNDGNEILRMLNNIN